MQPVVLRRRPIGLSDALVLTSVAALGIFVYTKLTEIEERVRAIDYRIKESGGATAACMLPPSTVKVDEPTTKTSEVAEEVDEDGAEAEDAEEDDDLEEPDDDEEEAPPLPPVRDQNTVRTRKAKR